jgi:hypothetical protein
MSYTDEDILDLYEDLQTIGAAETPQEKAEALFKGFVTYADEHIDPSTMKWIPEVNQALIRWLLKGEVPISFVLVLLPGSDSTRMIFPLYKGLTIYPRVLPLADYIQEKAWTEAKVSTFDTIDQLQKGVRALRAKTQDPAASESILP